MHCSENWLAFVTSASLLPCILHSHIFFNICAHGLFTYRYKYNMRFWLVSSESSEFYDRKPYNWPMRTSLVIRHLHLSAAVNVEKSQYAKRKKKDLCVRFVVLQCTKKRFRSDSYFHWQRLLALFRRAPAPAKMAPAIALLVEAQWSWSCFEKSFCKKVASSLRKMLKLRHAIPPSLSKIIISNLYVTLVLRIFLQKWTFRSDHYSHIYHPLYLFLYLNYYLFYSIISNYHLLSSFLLHSSFPCIFHFSLFSPLFFLYFFLYPFFSSYFFSSTHLLSHVSTVESSLLLSIHQCYAVVGAAEGSPCLPVLASMLPGSGAGEPIRHLLRHRYGPSLLPQILAPTHTPSLR